MTARAWPIWVISLPGASERRAATRAQLEAQGLPFTFLDAVDGRKRLPARYEDLVDRPGTIAHLGYAMSDAEYACAVSHQLAYKKLVDEDWPGAVILEDDVLLTEKFRTFYDTRGYEAAPLIQLFYFDAVVRKTGQRSTAAARLVRLVSTAWMTVGYSISAEAAAKLRAHALPLRGYADWPCDTGGLIGHYVTEPRIVFHADPASSQSTIQDSRQGLIPEGFDFTARYAKGWRRLFSLASWKRLLTRGLREHRRPGFTPTAEEEASLVRTDSVHHARSRCQ